MKTIIIIITILALILFFDFWSVNFFEKEIVYYNETIDGILSEIDSSNYETLNEDMESLVERWEKRIITWNILSDHNEVESIATCVHTSQVLINTEMYDDAIVELNKLRCSLEYASTRYVFILGNIF